MPPARRARARQALAVLAMAFVMVLGALSGVDAQQAGATPRRAGSPGGNKPVDIVADRLVVEQESQIATFSGNVNAVQGDMTLRADRLKVFYSNREEQQAGSGDQSIRRIEADGNVLVTTPAETAAGDAGVYDPTTGKVTLEGNVVLTRGESVVRGSRLVSDLNTGVSTVTAAGAGKQEQRVRARFVQEQNEGGR